MSLSPPNPKEKEHLTKVTTTSSRTNQLPGYLPSKSANQLSQSSTSKSQKIIDKNTTLTLMIKQMDNTTVSFTTAGDEKDEEKQENIKTILRHETENDDGTLLMRNDTSQIQTQTQQQQPQHSDLETGEEATAAGISAAVPIERASADREITSTESKSLTQLLSSSLSLKTQRYESSGASPAIEDPAASIEVFTDTTETSGQTSLDEYVNLPSSWTSSIAHSLQNSLGVIATGIADQDLLSKINESTDGVILRGSSSAQEGDKQKNATRLSVRAKKKSWYNVLYPNYKSRADDFKKLFKEIPNEERLIVDYSCALQREILLQGRMYVSQNYVCFHANIFRWETYLSIEWKDVVSITKEKTALVIPNAISISTAKEKYFFATFTSRDKAFLMLFRVWQNTLMKKPMPAHEIWQWVHNCYGDELGLTTDDEDYIDPNSVQCDNELDVDFISAIEENSSNSGTLATADNAINSSNSNQSINQLGNHSNSMSSSNSSCAGSDTRSTGNSSEKPKSKSRFFSKTSKIPQTSGSDMNSGAEKSASNKSMPVQNIKEECGEGSPSKPTPKVEEKVTVNKDKVEVKRKGNKSNREKNAENLPTDISDSSDSEENKIPFVVTAVCDSPHEGRQIVHTILPINIETVFNIMFTNSKFMSEFHKKRRTEDFICTEWTVNKDGTQSRTCNLTVQVSASVGPKTARVLDEQLMRDCSKPGELYSIDCVTTNSGIPYADSFCVIMHFCLVRTADDNTMVSMHAQIKYKKSIWGVVKSLIEKNTWSGIEEFHSSLIQAIQNETNIPPAKGKGRRPRRGTTAITRSIDDVSTLVQSKNDATAEDAASGAALVASTNTASNAQLSGNQTKSSHRWLSLFVVVLLLFLIVLNVLLLHKLWQLETRINDDVNGQMRLPNFSQLKQLPNTNDEWVKLLHEQETLHERELQKWHTVLQTAIELLRKIEKTLTALMFQYE